MVLIKYQVMSQGMYIIQGIILGNVKYAEVFMHWVLRYMHCAFVVMKKIYTLVSKFASIS